ncbi:glycosyltransferase [Kitasatospora sp. NPDC085464]|uniref:glycosyltransferase n=1 Tax=Kitasatospora sp. NPDC085464 TaxID=3364063 RepID=UPI0037C64636
MAGDPAVTPLSAPRPQPPTGTTRDRPRRSLRLPALTARLLLPVSLLLWLLALRHVDLDRMGDLGLLQVLPVLYWVAAGLLTAGFVLALRDRSLRQWWLAAYVLALIAVVHATPTLLYANLRYSWAWKHVAVIDAMLRHGGAVPHAALLDPYNQWPGFFVLNGLLLRVTGLHSALGYASWGPPLFNALLLAPLLLLYRAISSDRTVVWGAVWIYFSCSWVGQDYFSPQAFALVLYVTVIAVVVRRLPDRSVPRAPGRSPPGGAPPGGAPPGGAPPGGAPPGGAHRSAAPRAANGAAGAVTASGARASGAPAPAWGLRLPMVLVLEAAIVCSHQLTPLMLISSLAALALPRRNRRVVLPPLLAAVVMTAVWDATVARPYLAANFGQFVKALATPDSNVTSGFANLGTASADQVMVDWIDRGLTAAVVLLAVIALVRRPWVRRTLLPYLLLAPVPLLAANSYGGEMLFRTYLFMLPAAAFLVAALVLRPTPRPRLRSACALVLLLAVLGGLFFGYDSKERMNRYTTAEVTATQQLFAAAPPYSVVVSVTGSVPGIYDHYEDHPQVRLAETSEPTRKLLTQDPLGGLEAAVGFTHPGVPAYLILSRAQAAETSVTGVLPADTVDKLSEVVARTPGFELVYSNDDAVVYRFVPNPLPGQVPEAAPPAALAPLQPFLRQGGGP